MRLLELFSGTGSVGKPWREKGHEVISLDTDCRYSPELCEDILTLDYCKLLTPDVIWVSPPCDQYSRARTRAKKPRNLALADSLVVKAIEIINFFTRLNSNLIWFIENGDSTLLWGREISRDLQNFAILDYCQYNGPGYRKRTKVAYSDNLQWTPRPLCNPLTCPQCVDGRHLLTAQQGPGKKGGIRNIDDQCSLDQLHGLPLELCEEILRVCEEHGEHY